MGSVEEALPSASEVEEKDVLSKIPAEKRNIVLESDNGAPPSKASKLGANDTKPPEGDGSAAEKVASHYNTVKQFSKGEREKSRIFHLRNFNNWTKSQLINDALQKVKDEFGVSAKVSVLDLCSGKGGDLLKWKIGRISQLICSDIAEVSLSQAEERYKEMRQRERNLDSLFSAAFLPADATRVRLRDKYVSSGCVKEEPQFHLISCQFALHYAFEARRWVENIADCLVPGGVFIATTPDSNLLLSELRRRGGEIENSVSRIALCGGLDPAGPIPLFGAQYDFHLDEVVNVPEFLVYFPLLQQLLEEAGLELVMKQGFADFLQTKLDQPQSRDLLNRMKAMEGYPAEEGESLDGDEDEYSAARDCLAALRQTDPALSTHYRIGTLSKSEWEAACYYIVLMFQKKR